MKGLKKTAIVLLFAAAVAARADDLSVAREALRDGLVETARMRAGRAAGDEARLVVAESYASEGRWNDVLKSLDEWGDATGEAFVYYRALALAKTGKSRDALKVLDGFDFQDGAYAARVPLVRAWLAMESGDKAGALKISKTANFAGGGIDSKMAAAAIFDANGDRPAAEALWREVVASTNAPEEVLSAAARNLGDEASLRRAYAAVSTPGLRSAVGLRLGLALIGSEETFAEGEALIRKTAKDAPSADGAREAFASLADAYLSNGRYKEAADAYREALEAWPEAAKDLAVHEGLGWALRGLGRYSEALEAFVRAEEAATNDVDCATAILEQGDVLSEASRGDEAMAKYRLVLEKYPSTPSGEKLKTVVELREKEALGRELYRSFRFSEAQEIFADIAKRDPSRKPRMDYLEMLCLYGQVKDSEASRKAKDLAAGSPDPAIRAEATLWLAKFFYNARQWPDSCELFTTYATNMVPSSAQAPSALLWASRAAFAGNDFQKCVDIVAKLAKDYPDSKEKTAARLVQGEALVEMSRLDEAILVLDGVASDTKATAVDRARAKMLKADALFVLGADNSARYREALSGYRSLQLGESLPDETNLELSFKIARTLEKLGRMDEAMDQYYGEVVCAYRDIRASGKTLGDPARATFAKAAFRLADELESRGGFSKAERILTLVTRSDVGPAAKEAHRRLERIKRKGRFE